MIIKAWGPLFGLFVLFGISLFGLLFVEHPKAYNPQPTKTISRYQNSHSVELVPTQAPNQQGNKGKQESSWIDRLFDKPTDTLLVVFNGFLVLFTYFLYRATAGLFKETAELRRIADEQRDDLSRSIAAAEKSAEAAKQSAESTVSLERPYLFVGEATIVQSNGPADPHPYITFSVTNLGRVPGVIRMIYAEATIGEVLDPSATYRHSKFKYAQSSIGGGQTILKGQLDPVSFDDAISEQDYLDAKGEKKMVILKILLVYCGPLDFTYYSAIAYRLDLNTGQSYPIGGIAYNYEIAENGRPTANTVLAPEIRIIP